MMRHNSGHPDPRGINNKIYNNSLKILFKLRQELHDNERVEAEQLEERDGRIQAVINSFLFLYIIQKFHFVAPNGN